MNYPTGKKEYFLQLYFLEINTWILLNSDLFLLNPTSGEKRKEDFMKCIKSATLELLLVVYVKLANRLMKH